MTLSPGERFGPYEITGAIGAGGMGEVFRARDTKLNRDVAIKVLPAAFAADPERLARFTREAQALASLNHPNIAAIYGLEGSVPSTLRLSSAQALRLSSAQALRLSSAQALRQGSAQAPQQGSAQAPQQGSSQASSGTSVPGAEPGSARPEPVEGPVLALVMELVEGEDLSAHIARGPIPMAEALPIARQIAEALEAAHEQGIVHRDLKPANIKVRADGTVKVLDFGLAKAMDPAGPRRFDDAQRGQARPPGVTDAELVEASNSPTMSRHMTEAGLIIGTAAYMSPEQARGKPVDKRADIWAFGVVLFEMLSGSRAFEAEDVSLTLSKVLQLEPDFDRLPPSVPARVAQVLRVCLRKDPKQRVADIRDARLALEGAFETAAPQGTAAPSTPGPRLPWIVATLAVILGAALSGWAYLRASRPADDGSTIRFNIEIDAGFSIAISPDGSRVLASRLFRTGGLWLRSMGQVDPLTLKGTEGAASPFWSPDGSAIGYFDGDVVKRVDLLGTPPQTLCESPTRQARGGAWSREGVILLGGENGPLHRVSASGGPTQPATELDSSRGETAHRYPQFLADGRFLYLAVAGDPKNTAIVVGALDSKTRKLVMASGRAVFAPPRHLLFLREATLMAQEVDPKSLDLRGEPRPVAEGVSTYGGQTFSASDNGILVLRGGGLSDQARQMSIVDRRGDLIEAFGAPASYQNPTLSSGMLIEKPLKEVHLAALASELQDLLRFSKRARDAKKAKAHRERKARDG